MRNILKKLSVLTLGSLAFGAVLAADAPWPDHPIKLIVPFTAGGVTDNTSRLLAKLLEPHLGQPVIVENRPGAGGSIGVEAAARQAPDGYTMVYGTQGTQGANLALYKKVGYDPVADFAPVHGISESPLVLVINPNRPFKSVPELIAYAKANPGKLNYGSAGNGTSHHLAGELFKLQTKTFITHIPYRGAGPALQDLIAGNVDMMFDGLGSSAQHIKSGRIRALMVSGDKRNPAFPDVPCAAESGLPDYTVTTWYGLWAPKGTPQAVQAQVIDQVQRIGSAEEIKSIWARNGADYGGMNQQQFAAMVHGEIARWAQVVKASGVKLE